jgi:hypothetical protein
MKRLLLALILSLLASPLAALPPPAQASLHAFLQAQFADARADYPETTYVAAFADLNGDGRDEALVSLYSGMFCGSGGCALYIYTPAGRSWREVAELTIVNAPVRLLATRTHGWRDLAVMVRGGGFERPGEARITFDGRTYASNPSLAPALRRGTSGRILIRDEDRGRPLFQ